MPRAHFVESLTQRREIKLIIDGTTIPLGGVVFGLQKIFYNSISCINCRTQQERSKKIIYLAPLLFDGTETHIAENTSATAI